MAESEEADAVPRLFNTAQGQRDKYDKVLENEERYIEGKNKHFDSPSLVNHEWELMEAKE